MKKVILLFYFIVFLFSYRNQAQSFLSLDGVEDYNGNSILVFRFGSNFNPSQHIFYPIYSYNIGSGSVSKIMDAYSTIDPWFNPIFKSVQEFEFRNDLSLGFLNIGIISIGTYYYYYIASNDTTICEIESSNMSRPFIDISKINPALVFYSDQTYVYRSFNGGYSFLEDSVINYPLISVSDNNDNIFFGINNSHNLIKSTDQGLTFNVVDNTQIIIDNYFNFIYDLNAIYIYRINKNETVYKFYVSNDEGNMSSWSLVYESVNPLFISSDSQLSGLVFLADGQKIYKSQYYGYNFLLYRELESEILGIYKKPSSDILYALGENYIYEITSDTVIIVADATIVGVDNPERTNPNCIYLSENYPNPFNPTTHFEFRIADFGFVSLKVYDVLGNEIATLVNEEKLAGEYEVEFTVGQDSSPNVASGIYFYQLKAGSFIKTKKMVLLK